MLKPDWNLAVAIAALAMSACARPYTASEISTSDVACQAIKSALVASNRYREDQIASCDLGRDDSLPGFYAGRVNAYCREDVCGSVLLGWFAVEASTGRVYEMDVSEWGIGDPVVESNYQFSSFPRRRE